MKTARDYGYSYAVSINATELYRQTGDDIPEEISEYWAGYNEYINETKELQKLKKEIKILKQHLCNCK